MYRKKEKTVHANFDCIQLAFSENTWTQLPGKPTAHL
jgi:hypothetical protein